MADAKPLAPITAGPLRVTREVDSDGYCQHTVRAPNHVPLAVLSNYNAHEQFANATLYAAAPELLAALRKLVDRDLAYTSGCVDGGLIRIQAVQAARNAIGKAIGGAA